MSAKGYALGQISDVRGLRVIVASKEDCYRALRAVERLWGPVAPAKDYVRAPKANGYQSLHVVVDAGDGHRLEVQIRTAKMHFFAEYGELTGVPVLGRCCCAAVLLC
jgi:(p)ppGpp synthase/HD superfamily hydrolase